jgi:hypothetical protein
MSENIEVYPFIRRGISDKIREVIDEYGQIDNDDVPYLTEDIMQIVIDFVNENYERKK